MSGVLNYARWLELNATEQVIKETFPQDQYVYATTLTDPNYAGSDPLSNYTLEMEWTTLIYSEIRYRSGQPLFDTTKVLGYYTGTSTSTNIVYPESLTTASVRIPAGMYPGPILPNNPRNVPVTVVNLNFVSGSKSIQRTLGFIQNWEPGVTPGDPTLDERYIEILDPTTSTLELILDSGPVLDDEQFRATVVSSIPQSVLDLGFVRLYARSQSTTTYTLISTGTFTDQSAILDVDCVTANLTSGTYTVYAEWPGRRQYIRTISNTATQIILAGYPLDVSLSVTPNPLTPLPSTATVTVNAAVQAGFPQLTPVNNTATVRLIPNSRSPQTEAVTTSAFSAGTLTSSFSNITDNWLDNPLTDNSIFTITTATILGGSVQFTAQVTTPTIAQVNWQSYRPGRYLGGQTTTSFNIVGDKTYTQVRPKLIVESGYQGTQGFLENSISYQGTDTWVRVYSTQTTSTILSGSIVELRAIYTSTYVRQDIVVAGSTLTEITSSTHIGQNFLAPDKIILEDVTGIQPGAEFNLPAIKTSTITNFIVSIGPPAQYVTWTGSNAIIYTGTLTVSIVNTGTDDNFIILGNQALTGNESTAYRRSNTYSWSGIVNPYVNAWYKSTVTNNQVPIDVIVVTDVRDNPGDPQPIFSWAQPITPNFNLGAIDVEFRNPDNTIIIQKLREPILTEYEYSQEFFLRLSNTASITVGSYLTLEFDAADMQKYNPGQDSYFTGGGYNTMVGVTTATSEIYNTTSYWTTATVYVTKITGNQIEVDPPLSLFVGRNISDPNSVLRQFRRGLPRILQQWRNKSIPVYTEKFLDGSPKREKIYVHAQNSNNKFWVDIRDVDAARIDSKFTCRFDRGSYVSTTSSWFTNAFTFQEFTITNIDLNTISEQRNVYGENIICFLITVSPSFNPVYGPNWNDYYRYVGGNRMISHAYPLVTLQSNIDTTQTYTATIISLPSANQIRLNQIPDDIDAGDAVSNQQTAIAITGVDDNNNILTVSPNWIGFGLNPIGQTINLIKQSPSTATLSLLGSTNILIGTLTTATAYNSTWTQWLYQGSLNTGTYFFYAEFVPPSNIIGLSQLPIIPTTSDFNKNIRREPYDADIELSLTSINPTTVALTATQYFSNISQSYLFEQPVSFYRTSPYDSGNLIGTSNWDMLPGNLSQRSIITYNAFTSTYLNTIAILWPGSVRQLTTTSSQKKYNTATVILSPIFTSTTQVLFGTTSTQLSNQSRAIKASEKLVVAADVIGNSNNYITSGIPVGQVIFTNTDSALVLTANLNQGRAIAAQTTSSLFADPDVSELVTVTANYQGDSQRLASTGTRELLIYTKKPTGKLLTMERLGTGIYGFNNAMLFEIAYTNESPRGSDRTLSDVEIIATSTISLTTLDMPKPHPICSSVTATMTTSLTQDRTYGDLAYDLKWMNTWYPGGWSAQGYPESFNLLSCVTTDNTIVLTYRFRFIQLFNNRMVRGFYTNLRFNWPGPDIDLKPATVRTDWSYRYRNVQGFNQGAWQYLGEFYDLMPWQGFNSIYRETITYWDRTKIPQGFR